MMNLIIIMLLIPYFFLLNPYSLLFCAVTLLAVVLSIDLSILRDENGNEYGRPLKQFLIKQEDYNSCGVGYKLWESAIILSR